MAFLSPLAKVFLLFFWVRLGLSFNRTCPAITAVARQIREMAIIPKGPDFAKGRGTFIPKKLVIKVGTIKINEMVVSFFMTIFKLLEITEAKASTMFARMLL